MLAALSAACSAPARTVAPAEMFAASATSPHQRWIDAEARLTKGALLGEAASAAWVATAELIGERRTGGTHLADLASARDALLADIRSSGRAMELPEVVAASFVLPADYREARDDVLWVTEHASKFPLPFVFGARRAFRDDPAMLDRLPCVGDETTHCSTGATRLMQAAEHGDRTAIAAEAKALLDRDPCDTRAQVLSVWAGDAAVPLDVVADAARDYPRARPRLGAIVALQDRRAADARLQALDVGIASMMLDIDHPLDAALVAGRAAEQSGGITHDIARALVARSSLALGDATSYLRWRTEAKCVDSPSTIAFETRFRGAAIPQVDAVAGEALSRSLTLAYDAKRVVAVIVDTRLPQQTRKRAAVIYAEHVPPYAAFAIACVGGQASACDVVRNEHVSYTALAELTAISSLNSTDWFELSSPEAFASPELPRLLDRLEASTPGPSARTASARVGLALRRGATDRARTLLADQRSPIADEDILAQALGTNDVEDDALAAPGVETAVSSFEGRDVERGKRMRLTPLGQRELARATGNQPSIRFTRANLLRDAGEPREAALLYERLLDEDVPLRARAELVGRCALAYLVAGDRDSAQRILNEHADLSGSFQYALVRGYLLAEADPAAALPFLLRAAHGTHVTNHLRDMLAYVFYVQNADADGRDFALAALEFHATAHDPAAGQALTDDDLRTSLDVLVSPARALTLPASSPALAYARRFISERLLEDLENATTAEAARTNATELLKRAPPSDPVQLAWMSLIAGWDAAVLAATHTPEESRRHLSAHADVVALASERRRSGDQIFDALTVRDLWAARDVTKMSEENIVRFDVRPQTPEGEDFVCRLLVRVGAEAKAVPHCVAAWKAGRRDPRLADRLAHIVVQRKSLHPDIATDAVLVKSPPADFGSTYLCALAKNALEGRYWAYAARILRTAMSKGGPMDADLADPDFTPALAMYDGVLARLMRPATAVEPDLVGQVRLAVASIDLDAAKMGLASMRANHPQSRTLRDMVALVEDDLATGRVRREELLKGVWLAADPKYDAKTAPGAASHVVKLQRAIANSERGDYTQAARLTAELAAAQPSNGTVIAVDAVLLALTGHQDVAKIRATALHLPDNDPWLVEFRKALAAKDTKGLRTLVPNASLLRTAP